MTETRTVAVTGASSGIGRATAVALGALGWTVAIGSRRAGALQETAAAVDAAGGRAVPVPLDVTEVQSIDDFFTAVEETVGPVDALVNNAGIASPGYLVEADPENLSAELATNLLGPLLCTRRALGPMLDLPGNRKPCDIVFVTSDVTRNPRPGMIGYSSSKAALETVARVVAMEVEGRGIRTTVVRVGPTLTDFATAWEPGAYEHFVRDWPRFGLQRHHETMQPEDVAAAIVHALTRPAHMQIEVIEVQPVAPNIDPTPQVS